MVKVVKNNGDTSCKRNISYNVGKKFRVALKSRPKC